VLRQSPLLDEPSLARHRIAQRREYDTFTNLDALWARYMFGFARSE
jgi:hypothetical protein